MDELERRFEKLPDRKTESEYNFDHFTTFILAEDVKRTFRGDGVRPGEIAPDFELPRVDGGGSQRLSDLRGQPIILHFGSYT